MFGAAGMKMLDISKREARVLRNPYDSLYSTQGKDVLPWIEKYTEGNFYLSDFSIGFVNPNDMLIFKLAFRR
jgi:hypothetical protein